MQVVNLLLWSINNYVSMEVREVFMAKSWKHVYQKKNGMSYEEKAEVRKDQKENKKNYTNFNVAGLDKETYCNPIYFGLIENLDGSINEIYLTLKEDIPTYVILGTKKPIEEYPKTELGFVTIHHVEHVISVEIPKMDNATIENMDQFVYMTLRDKSKNLEEKVNIIQSEINVDYQEKNREKEEWIEAIKNHYTNFGILDLPMKTYREPVYFGNFKNSDGSVNSAYLVLKENNPTYVILGEKTSLKGNNKEYVISAEIPKMDNATIENMDEFVYVTLKDGSKTLEEKINIIQPEINVGLTRKLQ